MSKYIILLSVFQSKNSNQRFAHQAVLLERSNGTWYPIDNTTTAHTICILKGIHFEHQNKSKIKS